MKRILLLTMSLLCLSAAIAQAEPDIKDYRDYLTAEQAYDVHAERSLTSPVISKIKPGDAIFITDRGPNAGDGYNQVAWFEVTRAPDGKTRAGYILADLFLQNNSLTYGATHFVCERKLDEEHSLATITLKAFDKNGRLLAASEPMTTIDAGFFLKPIANRGLRDVQFMIYFYTSAESCGNPDCSYYYAWTGTDLVLLPSSINSGADVLVDYQEKLLFPDDGAPYDTIIKAVTATEYFDNDDEEGHRIKSKHYAAQIYLWDGKRAVLQSPEPKLFDWFRDHLERWHYKNNDNSNDTSTTSSITWIQRMCSFFAACRLRISEALLQANAQPY